MKKSVTNPRVKKIATDDMHIKHNALLTSVLHMYQVYCYMITQYEKTPSYVDKKKGYNHLYK